MLPLILFLTGITLSSVAAFYSITGLAYVFAGAFYPIVVMGAALEAAKLVGASWVFRSWRTAPKILTAYVSIGVLLLMLLTGVGIFGYLSRAYLTQQAPITALQSAVASANRDVASAQETFNRDTETLRSMRTSTVANDVIGKLTEKERLGGTNGAVSVLRSQQALQNAQQAKVAADSAALRAAEQTRDTAQLKLQQSTVDVGPLMFAAKAWFGTADTTTMDHVVTWFIGLIMMVFDPMAISLLLAAQSMQRAPLNDPFLDLKPVNYREPPWNSPPTPVPSEIEPAENMTEMSSTPTHFEPSVVVPVEDTREEPAAGPVVIPDARMRFTRRTGIARKS